MESALPLWGWWLRQISVGAEPYRGDRKGKTCLSLPSKALEFYEEVDLRNKGCEGDRYRRDRSFVKLPALQNIERQQRDNHREKYQSDCRHSRYSDHIKEACVSWG